MTQLFREHFESGHLARGHSLVTALIKFASPHALSLDL